MCRASSVRAAPPRGRYRICAETYDRSQVSLGANPDEPAQAGLQRTDRQDPARGAEGVGACSYSMGG